MKNNLYNHVNLYIDESGDISSSNLRELRLIGGIIIFGSIDNSEDKVLLRELRSSLEKAGGRFPGDLKYHKGIGQQSAAIENKFLLDMGQRLKIWAGDSRAVYGFYIIHDEDRFSDTGDLLDESRWDNRYKEMLTSTLEYLMFVSPRVRKRIAQDASWKVTVASRVFPVKTRADYEQVENLGYKIIEDSRAPGQFLALGTIDTKGLGQLIQQIIRNRWTGHNLNLSSVEVSVLDYRNGQSPPSLYLADLYCGSVRKLLRRHSGERVARVLLNTELAPTLEAWNYSGVDMASRFVRALDTGDVRVCTRLIAGVRNMQDNSLPDDFLKSCTEAYQRLIDKDKRVARSILEEAVTLVDEPGRLAEAKDIIDALSLCVLDSPLDRCRILLVRMSHANHIGNIDMTDNVWRQYEEVEPLLLSSGASGLTLRCEMRNRRAVSLTDQFRYEAALDLLQPLIENGSAAREELCQAYGISQDAPFPDRPLGACFGTMGQVCAFFGTLETQEAAEKAFRLAMSLFDDQSDKERQWIYLGHLACDLDDDEQARALFQEVSIALPMLTAQTIPSSMTNPFLIALWLKGRLRFGKGSLVLEPDNPFAIVNLEENAIPDHHPYGLILQVMGMLAEQQGRTNNSEVHIQLAHCLYCQASSHMGRSGKLLRVLSCVATLRAALVVAEDKEATIRRCFLKLRSLVMLEFGEHVWGEDESGRPLGRWGQLDPGPGNTWEARAIAVLRFIKFNYW